MEIHYQQGSLLVCALLRRLLRLSHPRNGQLVRLGCRHRYCVVQKQCCPLFHCHPHSWWKKMPRHLMHSSLWAHRPHQSQSLADEDHHHHEHLRTAVLGKHKKPGIFETSFFWPLMLCEANIILYFFFFFLCVVVACIAACVWHVVIHQGQI